MVVREVWVVITDGVREVEVETAASLLVGRWRSRVDDGVSVVDGGVYREDGDDEVSDGEVEDVRTAERDVDLQTANDTRRRYIDGAKMAAYKSTTITD